MTRQRAARGILLATAVVGAGANLAPAQALAPGSVQYHPGDPSASRLEMTIPADSLEVLTPPDTAVKQTDFGIKPFSGGPGGSVKVANRVTFAFDAVGVREPAH
jgi:hypothetical protein